MQMPVQRPELCPICGQGSALTFRACASCAHLALICDEEGTFFPNPRDLTSFSTSSVERCPSCRTASVREYRLATWDEIQSAGFLPGEYV